MKWTEASYYNRAHGIAIDYAGIGIQADLVAELTHRFNRAFEAMRQIENGAQGNPDEGRMVGHYWLRAPELAPTPDIRAAIEGNLIEIERFVSRIRSGELSGPGGRFKDLLVIGIGGSALGPQLVSRALGTPRDPMRVHFFDNTDPDGIERVLNQIEDLGQTLVLVISKSGGTKETRNGFLIAQEAWRLKGLSFSRCAVAITGEGSELDMVAKNSGWLARFPMWDWVGGRTSELSAVGLLPAALQGISIAEMLQGARTMDELTRARTITDNPAAILALSWYAAGSGVGAKDMVILPYKDRLELMSRYLQQLVMESLGKKQDRSGAVVHQGIAVYGNKGSTDQHAYVQQLRDGLNNFFVIFIEALKDKDDVSTAGNLAALSASSFAVEPGVYAGDYLSGFLQGTRAALEEANRQTMTITLDQVSAYSVGQLIALFERAVGLYAELININAYHQPGVEAGKKAATEVLVLQAKVLSALERGAKPLTVAELADNLMANPKTIFRILRHLAANNRVAVEESKDIFEDRYSRLS